jgi:chromosome segregation ATPase
MTEEREALRAEVEQLRKQLEDIQSSRASAEATTEAKEDATGGEIIRLREELAESEASRERTEEKYETLLGRVEKIKKGLAERLKGDKAELEAARDRIDELEAQNTELRRSSQAREDEAVRLRAEAHETGRELATLRSRTNLSQQNWGKEKEDMARQLTLLRGELESTSNAMGEWEVIAMEERSMRESLSEKVTDLEEQVTGLRVAYERAAEERDTQGQAVDGLQRALGEIQEARKRELREMVETTEEQLQGIRKRAQEADQKRVEAETARETLTKELERTAPFEKEVKEKNLLIGKLRHEAIVLNDHLTKALKYIKKTKPEETIDRLVAVLLGHGPWHA